jgi:hypothetical protein
MPSIADHWVRLTDAQVAAIESGPRDQEDDETDSGYLDVVLDFLAFVTEAIEDGLETW